VPVTAMKAVEALQPFDEANNADLPTSAQCSEYLSQSRGDRGGPVTDVDHYESLFHGSYLQASVFIEIFHDNAGRRWSI
jgi:hypothetical protein